MNTEREREREGSVGNSGEKVTEAERLEIFAGSRFSVEAACFGAAALSQHAETFFREGQQKPTG